MNSIPDFSDSKYSEMIEALLKGSCIFVGAGISKLAGYKLWKELADEIVEIYWQKKDSIPRYKKFNYSIRDSLKENNDSIVTMDYLFGLNQSLFIESIKDIFDNTKEYPEVYKKFNIISRYNFFIQTNIDTGLQKHLNIGDSAISINPELESSIMKINYIHGHIKDENSWILTQRRYDDVYLREESGLMKFLENVFTRYNVFFFGYSLKDVEILQAISKARLSGGKKKHYTFEGIYRNNKSEMDIRKTNLKMNYGIETISFNIEKNDYKTLLFVLNALNETLLYTKKKDKNESIQKSFGEGISNAF